MPIAEDPSSRPQDGESDPFADLVLDEDFVKGAAVKEQSARARGLAAKWKRQPPTTEQTAWRPPTEIRRRWYQRRAQAVDPWGNPKRRGQLNWQTPVFVLLAGAVVAAALNVNGLHDWYQHNFGAKSGGGIPLSAQWTPKPVVTQAPETAAPTAAPSTEAPITPTVAHPWAGSPAESWPAGADAIVLPPASDIGAYDKDQVTEQLKVVKQFLVAANLDPAVVAGGNPQQALDLLGGKSHDYAAQALAHPNKDQDPTSYFSRFNPKTAIPAGTEVKLQGRMTVESDGENGVVVHTDYTFVYAVVPGPQVFDPRSVPSSSPSTNDGTTQSVAWHQLDPTAEVTREIVRRVQDFVFYDPDRYKVQPGKVYFGKGDSDMGNNYCEGGDGWLEPVFPQPALPGEDDSPKGGSTTDPYDRSKPLGPPDGKCGSVSRT